MPASEFLKRYYVMALLAGIDPQFWPLDSNRSNRTFFLPSWQALRWG